MPTVHSVPSNPVHRPHAARQRGFRMALWLVGGVVAVLLLALVVLANWDWNRARPWVNDKVSEATGRHFAIQGDLSTDWSWPQPLVRGWQRWIPGLTVHARDVVLGNRPDFGRVGALDSPTERKAPPAFALGDGNTKTSPSDSKAQNNKEQKEAIDSAANGAKEAADAPSADEPTDAKPQPLLKPLLPPRPWPPWSS